MLNIRYGIKFMAKHVVFMAAADIQRMMVCTLFLCEAGIYMDGAHTQW